MNRGERAIFKKLIRLNKYVNLIELMDKNEFKDNDIKRYYRTTKYILYRVFGHPSGYMHMAVSENGKTKKSDYHYHPRKIAELIREKGAKNVLELGSGQGANLNYLAKRFPDVHFTGVDLYPGTAKRNNISIYEGNYRNLKMIESDSVDIVYAIETLCYSTDKQKVYDEVYRVLKKDGMFIVWDGYLAVQRERLTPKQLVIVEMLEHGFYLNRFEYLGESKNYQKKFKLVSSRNMKNEILPAANQSVRRIERYMKFGIFFKIFCSIFPKEFIDNLAPIYLMADSLKYDLSVYYELRYKK